MALQLEKLPARNGQPTLKARLEDGREIFLHSSYAPEQEAERWASTLDFDPTNLVALFGMGLGYHLKALLRREEQPDKIIVVEPNPQVLELAREEHPELFRQPHVFIASDWESFLEHYTGSAVGWQNIFFARIPAYSQVYPGEYTAFTGKIKRELIRIQAEWCTGLTSAVPWQRNFLKNLRFVGESAPVASIFGKFSGKPVVIVSAGPSLEKNVDLLHEAKNRVLIIAVGTVAKLLQKKGITPDLMITFDGGTPNYQHFHGLLNEGVPLIYDPAAHFGILEEYQGPKVLMLVKTKTLESYLKRTIGFVLPGPSIANTAFDLACHMGADPVILIGQDLAYAGERSHAEGTSVDRRRADIQVEGFDGRPVWTSRALLTFLHWFEKRISELGGSPRVIDATEGGAKIAGTEILTFRQALQRHCQRDLASEIEAIRRQLCQPPDYDLAALLRQLKTTRKLVRQLIPVWKKQLQLSQRLVDYFAKGKPCNLPQILRQMDKLDARFDRVKGELLLLEYVLGPVTAMIKFAPVRSAQAELAVAQQCVSLYSQMLLAFQDTLPFLNEAIEAMEQGVAPSSQGPAPVSILASGVQS